MNSTSLRPNLWLAVGALVLLILFYMSLPNMIRFSTLEYAFFAAIVGLSLLALIALRFGRFVSLSISFLLLVFINFVSTPVFVKFNDFKTLPPNFHLIADVEPGIIEGVSGLKKITTDSHGFRTTHAIDYENSEPFRIFAIGGSTTEDIALDDAETWTALLEDALVAVYGSKVEVVNTGLSGLRARHHLATLNYIADLHPDMAVFLVGINDWNNHISDGLSDVHAFTIDNSLIWQAAQTLKAMANSFQGEPGAVRKITAGDLSRRNKALDRKDRRSIEISDVSEDYRLWMERIADRCAQLAIKCVYVTQPTAYHINLDPELRDRLWMTPPDADYTYTLESMIQVQSVYNRWLSNFAESQGSLLCDLVPKLEPTTANFYDDCHFTEAGARMVAEAMRDCLFP